MTPELGFLRGHRLTVYSSNGCPDRTRLKQWMQRADLQAEQVLIDEEAGAADKLERETGKQALPFILIDGRTGVRGHQREKRSRFNETLLLAGLKQGLESPRHAPSESKGS
jgi:glutaredoxin